MSRRLLGDVNVDFFFVLCAATDKMFSIVLCGVSG